MGGSIKDEGGKAKVESGGRGWAVALPYFKPLMSYP